ncbi:MAG: ATP-binding protein [Treponemataceae bacterium]
MNGAPLIRVLLVFPNEREALAIKTSLAASPDPVDSGIAGSVTEALAALVAAPFDLVISAVTLPDGGAAEIAVRYPIVSCVAVGSKTDDDALDTALNAGVIDYLLTGKNWTADLGAYIHRLWRIRRRLAIELGHAAKRYEDLVDALPDIVYELNPEGHFTFINQSVKSIGYRPEDLIGKHFSCILFDEDVPHVSRDHLLPYFVKNKTGARNAPKLFDERRGVDRKTENLEIRLKRPEKKGVPRGGDMIASIISYGEIASAGAYRAIGDMKEKVFVGTVGIIRDITLRRKSEDMLRKMYQAVDQSPIAVAILTRDLTIEYVNPAFFAITGSGPDQAIGRKVGDYLGEASDRTVFDDLVASVRAGIDWHGEMRCPRVNADPFWSSTFVSAIRSPSGVITHYLCLIEDITRKRTLDDLLKQAKVGAEDASRAKSEFLANMSHELRTPLSGVISIVEVLLSDAPAPGQVDRLQTIRSSAKSLLSMLNDLLDLSKIEARALELTPEDVDLNDFVSVTLAPYRIIAEEKKLPFSFLIEDGGFPVIRVDRGRLAQIITNLVSNAVKFTEKGSITVRFAVRAKDGVPALFVSVRDTGIGISGVDQQKLFKHFSQVDASRSKKFGGTGLGLAIAKELAFRLGGDIWVESSPGVGSTFSFFVPVEQVRIDLLAVESDEPIRAPRAFNILVAEDNPVNQDYLRFFLEKAGHSVSLVPDGYGAISALGGGDFDIILMDIQMPGMDGTAAAKAIRSYSGVDYDPNVPIIALTAFGADEIDEAIEKVGFDAYASKPINPRSLIALIDDTVLGKVHFDLARLKRQYAASVDEFRRLLMIASQDLPKRVSAFVKHSAAGDYDGAKSSLHGVVNVLSALSALRALQLIKRYRKVVKEDNRELATVVAEDIKRECEGIRKLVKKALEEL